MPVTFKDSKNQDIEPGDTVRIIIEVLVETVEGNERGSQLTYADPQRGRVYVPCGDVERTQSRV